jgi:lysophospholipase L1-like esterase
MGSTPVTCVATDAVRRTASCSFSVSVVPPVPRLGITTILAFGDSITEGEVPVVGEFPTLSIRPRYVELSRSYPADLTVLLASRYSAQGATPINALTLNSDNSTNCWTDPPAPATSGIVVINAGCLGEQAGAPLTLARLNGKIAAYHPDLVLLLEGTNDLSPSSPTTSIANGVNGIQTLVRAVRSHGTPVMVGTLLPQIASDLTHGGAPNLVLPFNTQLVPAAIGAGARVVDLYSDIATDETDWISPLDGMHPTEAGYAETARMWFNAVQHAFELPSSTAPANMRSVRPCAAAQGSPCKN